jgi:hypothetical protein
MKRAATPTLSPMASEETGVGQFTPAPDWEEAPIGPRAAKRARRRRRETPEPTRSPVELFLRRHAALLRGGGDVRMDATQFHVDRWVHGDADRERNLFARYDATVGHDRFEWARTHYALGRRVQWRKEHARGCTGFAGPEEKPQSVLGKVLAGCDCPTVMEHRAYVWLVSPRDLAVTRRTAGAGGEPEVIRHLQPMDWMPPKQ